MSVLFLSDFHLGTPDNQSSLLREKKICELIRNYQFGLQKLYLVGDIFDFWFEYDTVAPKGYYRFLGLMAELYDQGIEIHYFAGNHDMWVRDLFTSEFGAIIHYNPIEITLGQKKVWIGHGDGLGPGDKKYKLLKKIFSSTICQFMFHWVHPDIGSKIAQFFSYKSRYHQAPVAERYHGDRNEWLYIYCIQKLKHSAYDYFIFGHRHLPIYRPIAGSNSIYINLGDWLEFNTYGYFNGKELFLYQYDSEKNNFDFDPMSDSIATTQG